MNEGTEYELAYIKAHPVITRCLKCKRVEPIHAPSIENVRCFYCSSKVIPCDLKGYRERLKNLWRFTVGGPDNQPDLFTGAT